MSAAGPVFSFTCSICGEASDSLCVYCTKDACANHLCSKCGRCSDCCHCEIPLEEPAAVQAASSEAVSASADPLR